jgi:ankyrin repeat protein
MNGIDKELIEAASENNAPEVRRLLTAGADIEAKTTRIGRAPLHWASLKGHVKVVNELLEHGADTESTTIPGWKPLHYAALKGHLAVFNELLSSGANMEATNSQGNTPLHFASWNVHLAIVKALLNSGANILAANNDGELPIDYALGKKNSALAKCLLLHFYATIRRLPLHELLEDLTWPYSTGIDTPPLRALFHRKVLGTDDVVEMVEYLVGQNPELLSSRDQDGSLPLHVACRRGASFPIVQSLVNHYKASVRCRTPHGDLPLFLACELSKPSLDTIFILVKLYPDLVYR